MNNDYVDVKLCEEMREECWDMLKGQMDNLQRIAEHGFNVDDEDEQLVKCAFQIIIGELNWRAFNATP